MARVSLDEQLARLASLEPADLRTEWEQVRGQPCHKLVPVLLRLGIAHRLQEKASGKRAGRIVPAVGNVGRRNVTPALPPGTQLVRSWNGRTVSVVAEERGFLFSGKHYPSLSAIARDVTGAHWSGPRFFGLTGKPVAKRQSKATSGNSVGGMPAARTVRCAVYARKSTEEGLEQDYNSLDAQYDTCAAYILSQRHEGWTLVLKLYDDGGFSGGNLERPALKQLLADVSAGAVDVIVLYKVDRLTRSLADFSKIVDVLDAAGASFVSVTQAFNTTTSMGRLMLNVLLSFAQFEREVTGERIRDKVAASKKKGLWMGGNPPLGYDVVDRKLVVNEVEADTVRHIFTRYIALGTGTALLDELREKGFRTKQRVREGKPSQGGLPFTRGMLFHLMKNRIYLGQTVHAGVAYPGEHAAIVIPELFEAVQQRIAEASVERHTAGNSPSASLLAGMVRDGLDRRMTPTHARKGTKRYRYYVTAPDQLQPGTPPAWRLPARDLELLVVARLQQFLDERNAIRATLPDEQPSAAQLVSALERATAASAMLSTYHGRSTLTVKLIQQVRVDETSIALTLDRTGLLERLGIEASGELPPLVITAAAVRVRQGEDVKLVFADTHGRAQQADGKLVALLAEARAARDAIVQHPEWTMRDAAVKLKQCRSRLAQLVRLSFLSPEIVAAIQKGSHPATLTPRALLTAELPMRWVEQKAMLGFG